MSDVTRILDRAQQGELKAADELLPLVYDELRKLAAVAIVYTGILFVGCVPAMGEWAS